MEKNTWIELALSVLLGSKLLLSVDCFRQITQAFSVVTLIRLKIIYWVGPFTRQSISTQ